MDANEIKRKDDVQGRVPFEYIRDIFSKENPIYISQQSAIIYDKVKRLFKLKIMGREYTVSHPEATMIDIENEREIKAYTIKTIVLRYLINSRAIPVFNKDITYKEVKGGLVYYRNFYNRTILKLAKMFCDNLEELGVLAKIIGGEVLNKGDAACKFEFINNVYITFIVWQGDDELPCSANILFDQNINYYFNAEDLAVIGDVAIELIKNKGEIPKWIGLYQKKTKDGYDIN